MAVRRVKIPAPYQGILSDQPMASYPAGFQAMRNVMIRKGKLVSRPALDMANRMTPPDGKAVLNLTSVLDIQRIWNTILLTESTAYAWKAGPPLSWFVLTNPSYVNHVTVAAAGTGYLAGDVLRVVQSGGASGCLVQVQSVGASGEVGVIILLSLGSGYSAGTWPTSDLTGTGTGCTITVTTSTIADLNSTGLPYAMSKVNNRLYFCNGSTPLLYTTGNGIFGLSGVVIAGSVPGACRFLTANAGHLIGAYWTEAAPLTTGLGVNHQVLPYRVRWSDTNNFNEWSEFVPTSTAGFSDQLTTPNEITGLSTIGNNSYIYRTNGLSVMSPTGNAASPFYISTYSMAPKGEGNIYPYALVSHNNVDRFIGQTDVWAFDGSSFRGLMEGKASNEFYADLAQYDILMVNDPAGQRNQIRGVLTTVLDEGYTYLAYVISIPLLNKAWVLNINENTWTIFTWPIDPSTPDPGLPGLTLQTIEEVYVPTTITGPLYKAVYASLSGKFAGADLRFVTTLENNLPCDSLQQWSNQIDFDNGGANTYLNKIFLRTEFAGNPGDVPISLAVTTVISGQVQTKTSSSTLTNTGFTPKIVRWVQFDLEANGESHFMEWTIGPNLGNIITTMYILQAEIRGPVYEGK